MFLKVSDEELPSSLKDILELGRFYFNSIDSLYPYIGSTQCAYDATEVLLLLIGMDGKYIQTHTIADYLCLTESKVKKAVSYLKERGLIYSNKKGLLVKEPLPIFNNKTTDEAFEIHNCIYCLNDWYADLSSHWKVMSFIHTLQNWMGLGVADCAKRDLAICIFKGKVEGFTAVKAKQITEAITLIDVEELADRYSKDTYREDMEHKFASDRKRMRCLGNYQKAKLILIYPSILNSKKTYYIPKASKEAVALAEEYFPYNNKQSNEEVLNKRNIFVYEYLVRQQITDDTDFNPMSPFYGRPLEERLEMLKDAVGSESDVYNKGFLTQKQWVATFNATDKNTSFLKALRTKVWWSPKKKKGKK